MLRVTGIFFLLFSRRLFCYVISCYNGKENLNTSLLIPAQCCLQMEGVFHFPIFSPLPPMGTQHGDQAQEAGTGGEARLPSHSLQSSSPAPAPTSWSLSLALVCSPRSSAYELWRLTGCARWCIWISWDPRAGDITKDPLPSNPCPAPYQRQFKNQKLLCELHPFMDGSVGHCLKDTPRKLINDCLKKKQLSISLMVAAFLQHPPCSHVQGSLLQECTGWGRGQGRGEWRVTKGGYLCGLMYVLGCELQP